MRAQATPRPPLLATDGPRMVQPLDISSHGRAILEVGAGTIISVTTWALTTEMIGLFVTVLLAALGGVVWLIRLEGQVQLHRREAQLEREALKAELDGVKERLDRIANYFEPLR